MRTRALAAGLLVFGTLQASGCASGGGTGGATSGSATPSRRQDRNVVSQDELRSRSESNLYDIVRAVRSEWLVARGAQQSSAPSRPSSATMSTYNVQTLMVYMNDQRLGSVDVLKDLSPIGVNSLRYYSPTEAQARFGTDNDAGAIQIIPVAGGRP